MAWQQVRAAIIPSSLLRSALRLDANIYIGDHEERAVARAVSALATSRKRLANARRRLRERDRYRKTIGIIASHE